jgi:hypothetical protein
VLVLDMIEILPPLGKYKYNTWRILLVKCYIDSSVRLRSCIQNINTRPTKEALHSLSDPLTLAFQHSVSKNMWLVQY